MEQSTELQILRRAIENFARASSLRGGAGIWDWDNISEEEQGCWIAEAQSELSPIAQDELARLRAFAEWVANHSDDPIIVEQARKFVK